jgi:hypothetical protein
VLLFVNYLLVSFQFLSIDHINAPGTCCHLQMASGRQKRDNMTTNEAAELLGKLPTDGNSIQIWQFVEIVGKVAEAGLKLGMGNKLIRECKVYLVQ